MGIYQLGAAMLIQILDVIVAETGQLRKLAEQGALLLIIDLSWNNSQRHSISLGDNGVPVAVINVTARRDFIIQRQVISTVQLRHDHAIFPGDPPLTSIQAQVHQHLAVEIAQQGGMKGHPVIDLGAGRVHNQ